MVIAAAVLLFIASFLSTYTADGLSDPPNSWDSLGTGLGLFMGGVVAGALIVVNRCLPGQRKVVGLDLGQLGAGFSVLVAWILFWTVMDGPESPSTGFGVIKISTGAGLVLGLISALVLAAAAIATPLLPPLQAPLLGAPRPAVVNPYGAQPQGGYGYPGAGQPSYGGPAQGGGQPYGAQPQQQTPAPAGAGGGDFSPFWFAVPVQRPLYAEDGSPTPIAELAPGTWYLAVEQRGPGLVAQTQDGRRGVLQDTTGIQRG